MTDILWGDLETFCEHDLKTVGGHRYAEAAEIMLFTWGVNDAPVAIWDLTANEPMPEELEWALVDPTVLVHFSNVMFDRTVMARAPRVHPAIRTVASDITRWRDTMVKAMTHSLPGSLDKQCQILKIPPELAKAGEDGHKLIQLFCKPRPKNMKLRRATRHTHPEEWAKFRDYARLDTEATRAVDKKLPKWNYSGRELELWHLDQTINDRGFAVDLDLANSAIRAVDRAQKSLAAQTVALTDGKLASTTQRDKTLAYILAEHGVELPDMQADTLERRLNDPELPQALRTLIAIRLQASTSSTSKYRTLIRCVSSDGRLRGTTQFAGALRTARWAGRKFQPQNLRRLDLAAVARWHGLKSLPKLKEEQLIQEYLDMGVDAIKADAEDMLFDDVMTLCGDLVRGAIIAPPGKKLVIADLANIEGRKAAWLAGEAWKLAAFAAYDGGEGPDLYKLAYARAFGIDPADVDKMMRQIGKVMELMLQYEGGVGAYLTGAATYGIDLDAMADAALPVIPQDVLEEAVGFWDWSIKNRRSVFGLEKRVFIACDSLKRLWRRAHPAITSYWPELLDAARMAICNPGTTYTARKLKLRRDGAWLRMGLPSGRALCYPFPEVAGDGTVSYMGVDQYTRRWKRIKTYGGKLFENAVQASSRDIMAWNMPAVETAGYEIILTVHDELLTETPDLPEFNVEHMAGLLAANPPWAAGLPLAADGFETKRYRKV